MGTNRRAPASKPAQEAAEAGERGHRRQLLALPGTPLVVLRAFLGVTFTFAGLQKLANPAFFNASSPSSFAAQVRGAELTSPLHHLLAPALHAPTAVALVIAGAELAVGLGTLVGLLARVAAVGGMLLALTFFLTVSFNDSPYYYGADIVFLFAWTPFVLGGAGALSLDAYLARRSAAARTAPLAPRAESELERRVVLRRLGAIGALAGVVVAAGGAVAGIGRALAPKAPAATGATTEPTSTTERATGPAASARAPAGTRIALADTIAVGGAAFFTDPAQQLPAYVVQPTRGAFRAFSAVCTHAGCQVAFHQSTETFNCPCHGSIFDAATGAVIRGPAARPLPSIAVQLRSDGGLYLSD